MVNPVYMTTNKHTIIRYRTIDRCLRDIDRQWTWRELAEACNQEMSGTTGKRTRVSKALCASFTTSIDAGINLFIAPTLNGNLLGASVSLVLRMPLRAPLTGNLNVGYTFARYKE